MSNHFTLFGWRNLVKRKSHQVGFPRFPTRSMSQKFGSRGPILRL
jgi:hypothetical protein